MKKALAIFMAVIMLSALLIPLSAIAAPAELATAFDVGVWPLAAGAYDPGLDGQGILDGTHVYGLFDASYAMLQPPASVSGYDEASDPGSMTPGTFYVLTASSGFQYVLVMSADGPEAAAPAPAAPAATAPAPSSSGGGSVTVYATVATPDGYLAIAGQPVTCAGSLDSALREICAQFYEGGEAGYDASINASFGMYLINIFWGVEGVPVCLINGEPMGYDTTLPYTADARMLEEGDNLVIVVTNSPVNIGLTFDSSDNSILAQRWIFNSSTYSYTNEAFQQADVVDPETGKVLGKTNAMGRFQLGNNLPECGVVSIGGVSAVVVGTPKTFDPYPYQYVPPVADYSLFGGTAGAALLRIVIVCVVLTIPLGAVVLHAQRTEIRNRGRKYTQPLLKK